MQLGVWEELWVLGMQSPPETFLNSSKICPNLSHFQIQSFTLKFLSREEEKHPNEPLQLCICRTRYCI